MDINNTNDNDTIEFKKIIFFNVIEKKMISYSE